MNEIEFLSGVSNTNIILLDKLVRGYYLEYTKHIGYVTRVSRYNMWVNVFIRWVNMVVQYMVGK